MSVSDSLETVSTSLHLTSMVLKTLAATGLRLVVSASWPYLGRETAMVAPRSSPLLSIHSKTSLVSTFDTEVASHLEQEVHQATKLKDISGLNLHVDPA